MLLLQMAFVGVPYAGAEGVELEYTKAVVALARGDAAAAEELLRRVLKNDPSNLAARHYLAKALAAQHRLTEAKKVLQDLLRDDPARARARL
ncbi:MAG: tetratricopeptide repeat protein, partial [Deltaproteobacteria bacterium]